MRFCGRDIITTWSLRTIIKAYYHQGTLPWKELMVNGWMMADKGVKISKRLGNAKMELSDILSNYGADVTRYWCANGAYGRDAFFSDDRLKDGYKLTNKLWNASKFVLSFLYDYQPKKPVKILPMDNYIMQKFNEAYNETIKCYENVEMGYAVEKIEKFFWNFCDNYIEIAKNRLYKPEVYGEDAKESAQYACYNVLLGVLKLFAITLPHMTEEIYQDYFKQFEGVESIHLTILAPIDIIVNEDVIAGGDEVVEIVKIIRAYKSENKLSMKTAFDEATITVPETFSEFVKSVDYDIKAVSSIQNLKYEVGELGVKFGNIVE